jgi:putative molybdopterin biosynthesis protein
VFAQQLKPLLKPGKHKLIGCTRRTQGLMLAPGNPLQLRVLADLARPGVRFVNRQAGSGTRLLTEHLLAEQGVLASSIAGFSTAPAEDSHLAVAAAVASGSADAGIGIEAAALRYGVGFIPLVEEDYFLVCLQDALEQPAVVKLREVLQSPGWRSTVAALPGYAAAHSGEVLSLTRALPWWRFQKRKAP